METAGGATSNFISDFKIRTCVDARPVLSARVRTIPSHHLVSHASLERSSEHYLSTFRHSDIHIYTHNTAQHTQSHCTACAQRGPTSVSCPTEISWRDTPMSRKMSPQNSKTHIKRNTISTFLLTIFWASVVHICDGECVNSKPRRNRVNRISLF